MGKQVYLDYNSTTPVDPRVLEEMIPFFNNTFGNSSSKTHIEGELSSGAVKNAREQVGELINTRPENLIFTSGATESINLALKGVYSAANAKSNRIITQRTEHPAVLDTCKYLESQGAEIEYLPVNEQGLINLVSLEEALQIDTLLVAIMYVNNETGSVQPIEDIARLTRMYGALLMCDATQAVGRIQLPIENMDYMAFSSHKIYGPKGIGCLYIGPNVPRPIAQIHGGGHEQGLRSGTLNVPSIVGFGKACCLCKENLTADYSRIIALQQRLARGLKEISGCRLTPVSDIISGNVVSAAFHGVNPSGFIELLKKDLSISSGSACTSSRQSPSHVLEAMGVPENSLRATFRFSLGRFTTEQEIDFTIETVRQAVSSLSLGFVGQ